MKTLCIPIVTLVCAAASACASSESPPAKPSPAPTPELPAEVLQQVTSDLVTRSGAPGAIVGVAHGDKRWIGAAGSEDLAMTKRMRSDGVFRAASITKMFTASVVMREIEAGRLSPNDKLANWSPTFPNADAISLDQLLSHTAGVTTQWFDGPELQAKVTTDLNHAYTPEETLAIMMTEPPSGAPGVSGMLYSNTDYVLLGDVATRVTGSKLGDLLKTEIFDAVPLTHTTYQFDNPPDLVPGYFEYQGLVLDASKIPQVSLVSFAGAAGAVHSTADDLLTFADALFRKKSIVGASSLSRMMTPAEEGSWYAHGLMRFCPCDDGPAGTHFTGWGHAGNLPGYWSEVVYYPDRDVTIVALINRDAVDGVALDHDVFDDTLKSVLDALATK